MKRMILPVLAAFMALVSCGDKVDTPPTPDVKFSVSPQTLTFDAKGSEQMFTVTSASNPKISPSDQWFTVDKGVWNKETYKTEIKVSAKENTATEARTGSVTITCGDEKQTVTISQDAGTGNSGGSGNGSGSTPVIPEPNDGLAWKVSDMLGIGWNLGNQFDAYNNGVSGETFWGNAKATQATFDKLKAAGFTTVRIPVTWMGHIGEAPDYQIEEAWLNRVSEVVGYAEKAGLKAILNMHHDGSESNYWLNIKLAAINPDVHKQIMEQVTAMWTQIAEKFSAKGDFLIFEAFNEIHDGKWGWGANRTDGGKQYQCLNEWNQAFVDAVRAAGGENEDRYLGIPAYCTNVDIAIESFVMPTDVCEDRLLVSVHSYDPSDYALTAKKSEWGHTATNSNKVPGDNESDLQAIFVKIYENFISKDIPVYLGEFGCVNRTTAREQSFQQYYLRYFGKLAKLYGVPSVIWDNGAKGGGNECHAFIDHGTGEYCSPEAKAAIRALVDSYNSDLTLEQVYNTAP